MHLQGEENHMLLTNNSFDTGRRGSGWSYLVRKSIEVKRKGIFKLNRIEELCTKAKMKMRLRI